VVVWSWSYPVGFGTKCQSVFHARRMTRSAVAWPPFVRARLAEATARAGPRLRAIARDRLRPLDFVGRCGQKRAVPNRRTLGILFACACGACGLLHSEAARADEPVEPIRYDPKDFPPSYAPGTLMLAGAATTAAWYGLALGGGLLWPDSPGGDDLVIPAAGPWMALADTGCPEGKPHCAKWWVVVRAILIGIDGVGQAGGLAVMAEAAFMPTEPAKGARARHVLPGLSSDSVEIFALPMVTGRDGLGLGVFGSF
jgi:hypothetical protein